jgi:Ca2+-transporting ATPase
LNNKQLYNLDINQALASLHSSRSGLDPHTAAQRLKQYGPNELTAKKSPLWKRIIEPFASYFAMVIIAAALLSVYERKWFEAIIISAILLINAIIYYFQQISVGRVLKTLRAQDKQNVDVIRAGHTQSIASSKLVPGDIVHVTEGMKIPADGRLIDVSHLQADESLLTGESLPIHKIAGELNSVEDSVKEVYDQKNMLFKGSYVRAGTGLLLVSQTGNNTQLGTINKLASEADEGKTPIERKIDELTKKLLIGIVIVSVAVFILAIVRGIHLDEALRFTLSLIVSAVPEGLPVAMTLVLLLSANGMAKQKALVKKLSALETLGAVTLIVTDKTGTITKNQLSVADHYTHHTGSDKFFLAVRASLNGTKDHSPDPLDALLVGAAGTTKIPAGWKKIHEFPFDQQQRLSGAVWQNGKQYQLFVKGAPEKIMSHTPHLRGLNVALSDFTSKGYRTIGFASKKLSTIPKELTTSTLANMQFDGFVGLSDQLRPNIQKAIEEAHRAGIKVVMLTGDHMETAGYVGRQTGIIFNNTQAADSSSLASASGDRIRTALETTTVFGRVLPEHKYALLKAVKGHEITAMTGDGVNDIPALVEADAGLAMGSGADAAKDASDVVLINSNFMTIINAVRTGRTVLANIRKMVVYLLGTSGGEVLTMLSALLLNIPLPITAVMVLWVNLVTDGVSVIPLGLSQSETYQMRQKPDNPNAPLLNKLHISRALLLSTTMAVTVLIMFKLHLPKGLAYAQTIAFLSLIVIQWANAFNMNFEHHSWLRNFIKPNFKLWAAISGSIVLNIILFCTPLRGYFSLATLELSDAVRAIVIPCAVAFVMCDVHKLVSWKFRSHQLQSTI